MPMAVVEDPYTEKQKTRTPESENPYTRKYNTRTPEKIKPVHQKYSDLITIG